MKFTLDDIAQEKSSICDVIINTDDYEVATKMNLMSIVSADGSKAQAIHSEAMAAIMPITAANIGKYQEANIEYALAVVTGWPEESDDFFRGKYSKDLLKEILTTPAFYPISPAIREASALSKNFIATALLKPVPS